MTYYCYRHASPRVKKIKKYFSEDCQNACPVSHLLPKVYKKGNIALPFFAQAVIVIQTQIMNGKVEERAAWISWLDCY